MPTRRLFLLNPRARGVSAHFIETTRRYFIDREGAFDAILCHETNALERAVASGLARGVDQLVAVGGDGTAHAVANALLNHHGPMPSLAVARAGTGSDYWRNLRHRAAKPEADWRETVIDHDLRLHDAGIIEWGERFERSRYFINMASFAWSARVVQAKAAMNARTPAALAYALPTLTSLHAMKAEPVRIKVDDENIERPLLSLFVCKGAFAGGGMRFGESVTFEDGAFDVLWLADLSLGGMLKRFPKLYGSGLPADEKVMRRRATQLELLMPEGIAAEIDGEFISERVRFRVRIEGRRLPVCVPRS